MSGWVTLFMDGNNPVPLSDLVMGLILLTVIGVCLFLVLYVVYGR